MIQATRPGDPAEEPRASLSLLDHRRRVADLYTTVRELVPMEAHEVWRRERDEIFRTHPRSAIPPDLRTAFSGLPVWDYDPALRFELTVQPSPKRPPVDLPHSGTGHTRAWAVGVVQVPVGTTPTALTIFRLDQYGDHLFLPFVDATAGTETYGGGRYLLDTAKGADLGSAGTTLVVDFNFAYHPSCVHEGSWSCPLAPASNRIRAQVRAGEHL